MVKRADEDDDTPHRMSMHHVLCDRYDFANETTALMERLRSRGHILLMCVKAHPELAGVGIENSWGKSAQHFRANNDCVSRHLHRNVLDSLHSSNLTLLQVCKFARRTRDYLLLYAQIAGGEVQASSHAAIEKLRKLRKTHRSAMDVDATFISNA